MSISIIFYSIFIYLSIVFFYSLFKYLTDDFQLSKERTQRNSVDLNRLYKMCNRPSLQDFLKSKGWNGLNIHNIYGHMMRRSQREGEVNTTSNCQFIQNKIKTSKNTTPKLDELRHSMTNYIKKKESKIKEAAEDRECWRSLSVKAMKSTWQQ